MDKTPVMNYDGARTLIQNGDLLSFMVGHKDRKLTHKLTELVTNSPYYHSGIAVWLSSAHGESRLFICEAKPTGRQIVPLSMYSNLRFDVTRCPVEFRAIERPMLEKVGSVPYSILDYVTVGLRMMFGISAKDDTGAEICSEMAQDLYYNAGLALPEEPLAPNELKEYLNATGYEDRVHVR